MGIVSTFAGSDLPAGRWTGWHRAGKRYRWVLICAEKSEEECFGRLHEQMAGGDFLIRRPGEPDPNSDRKPR